MSPFAGGSPWAMARDISEGYLLVTERTFGRMSPAEMDKLSFEIERSLREIRSAPTAGLEAQELQRRNRKLMKLSGAKRMVQAQLTKRRR